VPIIHNAVITQNAGTAQVVKMINVRADALREAGYVRLRRLLVPVAMRDEVETRAEKSLPDIQRIKEQARERR
jgi:hypothetical protein